MHSLEVKLPDGGRLSQGLNIVVTAQVHQKVN